MASARKPRLSSQGPEPHSASGLVSTLQGLDLPNTPAQTPLPAGPLRTPKGALEGLEPLRKGLLCGPGVSAPPSLDESSHTWDFPSGPVVKTSPSNAGGPGWIIGQAAKIPHSLQLKTQNKNKKIFKKLNGNNIATNSIKTLKMVHIKKNSSPTNHTLIQHACSVTSVVTNSVTPGTVARQAPLSTGSSRQGC